MGRDKLEERIRRRLQEAAPVSRRADTETQQRRERAPRPGDLFVFPETSELPVQWAVIDREDKRFQLVPADSFSLTGSRDVAIPPESPCGALSLRCDFAVWRLATDIETQSSTGFLDDLGLSRARSKLAEIEAGRVSGTSRQHENDIDPEYQDWIEEVPAAAQRLVGTRERPVEVKIRVEAGGDVDAEDVERLSRQLMVEIRQLAIENVARVQSQEIPEGARTGPGGALGSLVVTIKPELLNRLIGLLYNWSLRGERRSVEVETVDGREIDSQLAETLGGESLVGHIDTLRRAADKKGRN